MDKSWKVFEREVSKFFSTVRNALSGMNSKVTGSDTHHPDYYIECKYRAKSSLHTLFKDTREKAKKENKIPIVCTKLKNENGFLVTIHCSDYEELVNKSS